MKKSTVWLTVFIMVAALFTIGAVNLRVGGNNKYVVETLTLSADATAQDLSDKLVGNYLFSVEIIATADDAMTFAVNSDLGTELFTDTTTAATSGEISNPSGYWPIVGIPTYTLSDLGSGTVTVRITAATE